MVRVQDTDCYDTSFRGEFSYPDIYWLGSTVTNLRLYLVKGVLYLLYIDLH